MKNISDFTLWVLKYYLPPMIANATPVLLRGHLAIDRGHLFLDRRPIFGKNKTWEGMIAGSVEAYIAGVCLGSILSNHSLPLLSLGAGISALLGDLLGAFIKRRIGINPGDPAPLLDQLDFALMATVYYYVVGVEEVILNPTHVLAVLGLILLLHIVTNRVAYMIGLKQTKF